MESGRYVDGSIWFYGPNKGAPPVFAVLFLASGLWHLYQCLHYANWRVTGLYPWSALLFVTGFVLREFGAFNYSNLNVFIASTVFLYAAPPIYELSNYLVLSRLLHYVPHLSPMHPGRVFSTFFGISTVIESLSASGAVQASNTSSSSPQAIAAGKALIKSALVLQLAVMVFFVALAGRFHYNCAHSSLLENKNVARRQIRKVVITLYLSSALILSRTVYRTVEYYGVAAIVVPKPGMSFDPMSAAVVVRYEWFFWVFEATLMVVNTWMINFRHPGRYLPRNLYVFLGTDGQEKDGNCYKDRRGRLAKILDPFDLVGLIKGSDRRWWEEGNVTTELEMK